MSDCNSRRRSQGTPTSPDGSGGEVDSGRGGSSESSGVIGVRGERACSGLDHIEPRVVE